MVAQGLGYHFDEAPNLSHMDGVDAFRRLIGRLYVDREKCGPAIELLKNYRAKFDQKMATLARHAEHGPESNWADSCRYFAVTDHRAIVGWESGDIDYSRMDAH